VRGDSGPTNHIGGATLAPFYSILTPGGSSGFNSTNSTTTTPPVVHQYCNGARSIPEAGLSGWQVPPGISDATVPNPIFNLTPVATVDEGNNWVNLRWGPLSLVNPATSTSTTNVAVGNYSLSAAIDNVPTNEALPNGTAFPTTDFFGNSRPETGGDTHFDAGAVEFGGTAGGGGGGGGTVTVSLNPNPLRITLATGSITGTGVVTLTNTAATGGPSAPITNVSVSGGSLFTYIFNIGALAGPNTCTGATLTPGASCNVTVRFTNTFAARGVDRAGTITFTVTGIPPVVGNLVGHAN
jgi:hypothetical protein